MGIILHLLDNKVELSLLSAKSHDWMEPIFLISSSLFKKREDNQIILPATIIHVVLYDTHRHRCFSQMSPCDFGVSSLSN